MKKIRMKNVHSIQSTVKKLVEWNIAFYNINKLAEDKIGLSLVQYHLLVMLRDMPGSSPQKIALEIGMHPSTLTQSIKRLNKKKMIFVEIDPRDTRKKIIGLTRNGELAIREFDEGVAKIPLLNNTAFFVSY